MPRARAVSVQYTDLDGIQRTLEADDYLARVFQHELDHLDGVLFLDRLPAEVTEDYRKELLALQQRSRSLLSDLANADQQRRERGEGSSPKVALLRLARLRAAGARSHPGAV